MRVEATRTAPAVIPTASMADIAFLLIIFFMVTFTIEVDKTQVTLPKTVLREEIPKKAAYVSITKPGFIKVSDGEQMSAPVQNSGRRPVLRGGGHRPRSDQGVRSQGRRRGEPMSMSMRSSTL